MTEKITAIRDRAPVTAPTPIPTQIDYTDTIKSAMAEFGNSLTNQLSAELASIRENLTVQVGEEIEKRVSDAMKASVRGASIGVFHALSAILAVRFLLMMSLVGGFVVALEVLKLGTYQADGVLVAYAALIVLPLVASERTKQK